MTTFEQAWRDAYGTPEAWERERHGTAQEAQREVYGTPLHWRHRRESTEVERLRKAEPTDAERAGGWRQVWEHPSGLRAARNPANGRWQVIDGHEIRDEGFCSSLRAAAGKIARQVERRRP